MGEKHLSFGNRMSGWVGAGGVGVECNGKHWGVVREKRRGRPTRVGKGRSRMKIPPSVSLSRRAP